jgi:hypothetical protein
MVWGFIALAIVVAIVLAGRAHSRYLDRQDQLYLLTQRQPVVRSRGWPVPIPSLHAKDSASLGDR